MQHLSFFSFIEKMDQQKMAEYIFAVRIILLKAINVQRFFANINF